MASSVTTKSHLVSLISTFTTPEHLHELELEEAELHEHEELDFEDEEELQSLDELVDEEELQSLDEEEELQSLDDEEVLQLELEVLELELGHPPRE